MTKQVSEFKLTGLSRKQSFSCEPLNNENIFWAKNGLGLDKFNELWDYCNGYWKNPKIAVIEHNGLYDDGTPINPIVIGIREIELSDVCHSDLSKNELEGFIWLELVNSNSNSEFFDWLFRNFNITQKNKT